MAETYNNTSYQLYNYTTSSLLAKKRTKDQYFSELMIGDSKFGGNHETLPWHSYVISDYENNQTQTWDC